MPSFTEDAEFIQHMGMTQDADVATSLAASGELAAYAAKLSEMWPVYTRGGDEDAQYWPDYFLGWLDEHILRKCTATVEEYRSYFDGLVADPPPTRWELQGYRTPAGLRVIEPVLRRLEINVQSLQDFQHNMMAHVVTWAGDVTGRNMDFIGPRVAACFGIRDLARALRPNHVATLCQPACMVCGCSRPRDRYGDPVCGCDLCKATGCRAFGYDYR